MKKVKEALNQLLVRCLFILHKCTEKTEVIKYNPFKKVRYVKTYEFENLLIPGF